MATVAVDLLGGDGAPEVVADAVKRCTDLFAGQRCTDVDLVVVGPAEIASVLLAERGLSGVRVVDARHGVSGIACFNFTITPYPTSLENKKPAALTFERGGCFTLTSASRSSSLPS